MNQARIPSPGAISRAAQPAYFPEIESLRGIAILLVTLHHFFPWVVPSAARTARVVSPVTAFVAGGQSGVSLFFVLSGFLLTLPFLVERSQARRVSRRRYFFKRACRILPLYSVAVLVGTGVAAWNGKAELPDALPYLVFANGVAALKDLQPFSGVWWSLATEVQFYLALPLVFALPWRWWSITIALIAYGVLLGAFIAGAIHLSIPHRILLSHSLGGRGFMFLLGGMAAWAHLRHGSSLRATVSRRGPLGVSVADLSLVVLLVSLAYLLRWQVFMGYWTVEGNRWHVWHLLEAALWTATLLVILVMEGVTKPFVCNRILNRLGTLSYSIYLIHLPLIFFGFPGLRRMGLNQTFARALVLSVVLLGLSTVTYRCIEQPFLRLKSRPSS